MIDLKFDFGFVQISYLSSGLMFLALFCVTWWPSAISLGVIISLIFTTDSRMRQMMNDLGETDHLVLAIERVYEFIELPPEKTCEIIPPSAWPSDGMIEVKNVSFSYIKGNGMTLDNLSFKVLPGEKIGIAGRTGSGKSTLFKLLLRIVELDTGSIIMDDLNTAEINLEHFRSKISIIQQDPILFRGTIRENLDPFSKYTDDDLWRVLETCQMKELIEHLDAKLNYLIEDDGKNFSAGERQLFTLARAILKNSKILLLDEATSSIDNHTDEIIQNIIRKTLNSCTMLIIAHRLNTILDSDRIMVLDHGKIVEFDTPGALLKDPESRLSQMVNHMDNK
jgi:ABC-type multidrug transport system fused ATPase/permease subunit